MDKNPLCSGKLEDICGKSISQLVVTNLANSLKSCSELSSLILRLNIIRAPRFCNLNSLSKYVLSELDHTISQYSFKG